MSLLRSNGVLGRAPWAVGLVRNTLGDGAERPLKLGWTPEALSSTPDRPSVPAGPDRFAPECSWGSGTPPRGHREQGRFASPGRFVSAGDQGGGGRVQRTVVHLSPGALL